MLLATFASADPLPLGATATDVLLVCTGAHVGGPGCQSKGAYWGRFAKAHETAGIKLDVVASIPVDLSHYRAVWVAYPSTSYTEAEVQSVYNFLLRGITTYGFAATNTIGGGTPLVGHAEGALVAFDRPGKGGPPNGEVVLFGDSNPFVDECMDVDNTPWVLAMAQ